MPSEAPFLRQASSNRSPMRMSAGYQKFKRVFDVVVAGTALVLLSPVLLGTALATAGFLGRPVLFRQVRPGRDERLFELLKFRSMRDAVDASGRPLPDEERITRYGLWLRSTSLDELPALVNVLRGEMSLVGPRPLFADYLPLYSPFQRRRFEVRPGITGLAQVSGRNTISWQRKFAYDVEYVDNASFRLDLAILARTVVKVLQRDGISEEGRIGDERFHGNDDPP